MTAPRIPRIFKRSDAFDCRAAGAADSVLHGAGVRAGGEMKLCRAGHHPSGESISGLARKAVFHAAVSECLKEHGSESRATAGKRARDGEQMPGKHLDKRDGGERARRRFPIHQRRAYVVLRRR